MDEEVKYDWEKLRDEFSKHTVRHPTLIAVMPLVDPPRVLSSQTPGIYPDRDYSLKRMLDAPIIEFKDKYHFLSNFHTSEFEWRGIVWPNAEAAYQSAKSDNPADWERFSKFTNPVVAKRAGKQLNLRSDWEKVKIRIMLEIVLAKFSQNDELKQLLLDTGDAHLEEGNYWGDRIWGVSPAGSGRGHNYLGQILMQVRSYLRG